MSLAVAGVAAAVACERSLIFVAPLLLWRERWDRKLLGIFFLYYLIMIFLSVYSRVAVVAVSAYSAIVPTFGLLAKSQIVS